MRVVELCVQLAQKLLNQGQTCNIMKMSTQSENSPGGSIKAKMNGEMTCSDQQSQLQGVEATRNATASYSMLSIGDDHAQRSDDKQGGMIAGTNSTVALYQMQGLAEANFCFDIKLQILKEYIRLWATRIGRDQDMEAYEPTNRAELSYSTLGPYGIDHISENKLLWLIHPIYRPHQSTPYIQKFSYYQAATIDGIFAVAKNAKSFRGPLEIFFFGQMLWEFHESWELSLTCQSLNQAKEMKKISLCIDNTEDCWEDFLFVLERLWFLVEMDRHFPKLEFLEIMVSNPLHMWRYMRFMAVKECGGSMSKVKVVRYMENPIRFMVRRCYQLVQQRPNLKVSVRSSFRDQEGSYKIRYGRRNGGFFRYKDVQESLGITQDSLIRFYNGTSTLHSNLPSIEFPDVLRVLAFDEKDLFYNLYWQMLFANEWRAIWKKGILLSEAEGGYTELNIHDLRNMGISHLTHLGPTTQKK